MDTQVSARVVDIDEMDLKDSPGLCLVSNARKERLENTAFVAGDALQELSTLATDSFDCVLATDCAYQ